ncbi:carboxylesterase family protein [Streptomyces sp. NBC_00190]|uniref:carboxylesterase family protein n=1 Tax=Streptomyces sp. NBC_00190 TaxID=2903634 RepID=UPI003FA70368
MAALLAMPRAAGLFGRAVAQSVQGTFFSPELASDIAAACAAELGRKPTVAGLSTVAPARLSTAGDAVGAAMGRRAERWGQAAHRSIPFSPVVDGDALPVTPWRALADGAGRDVELLVGHTRDEQRLLTALDGLRGQVTPQQAASALDVFRRCPPACVPRGRRSPLTATPAGPRTIPDDASCRSSTPERLSPPIRRRPPA